VKGIFFSWLFPYQRGWRIALYTVLLATFRKIDASSPFDFWIPLIHSWLILLSQAGSVLVSEYLALPPLIYGAAKHRPFYFRTSESFPLQFVLFLFLPKLPSEACLPFLQLNAFWTTFFFLVFFFLFVFFALVSCRILLFRASW